jgi:acyl-CoA synthetase (AMP-forming)/AMP-acid ligase II
MAAIVLRQEIDQSSVDWPNILSNLSSHLPTYARPAFFRIQSKLATTSTYKHLKTDLVKEVSSHLIFADDVA